VGKNYHIQDNADALSVI